MHQRGNRLRSRAAIGTLAGAVMLATSLIAAPAGAATDDPRVDTVYEFADDQYTDPGGHLNLQTRSIAEMGDRIALAGEARTLDTVQVTLQSFACQSGTWNNENCTTTSGATFSHPITVNIYAVAAGGSVGAKLATLTRQVNVRYRPSAQPGTCVDNPDTEVFIESAWWYDAARGRCVANYVQTVTFDLHNQGVVLPDQVIATVKFPTSRFGSGLAIGGPYDSLDVSLADAAPTTGTNVDQGIMYFDSSDDMNFPSPDEEPELGVLKAASGWQQDNNYYRTPLITVTATPQTARVLPATFVGGFEQGTSAGLGLVTRVNDGTLASAGCWYAEAPVTNYGTHNTTGTVTMAYGGYATEFPSGGYTASADFYLDADAAPGQFTWAHGVNGTDGALQRSFMFYAGADGSGTWTIGTGTTAAQSSPYRSNYGANPLYLDESGWYTLRHKVYAQGGLLYADLSVLSDSGTVLKTWTLGGNAGDLVPTLVGGNRYGWLINNSYAGLRMDNVVLGAPRPTDGCVQAFTTAPRPVIKGSAQAGKTLRAVTGAWAPEPESFAYQWLRNGVPIAGETGRTYTVTPQDRGKKLRVEVTASRATYTDRTVKSATLYVPKVWATPDRPALKGTMVVGRTIWTATPAWSPKPDKIAYQWVRDGRPIVGAKSRTYVLREADSGHVVKVRIIASKDGYLKSSVYSQARRIG
ncbi:hypothetical protein [Demequina phytophila]|uniref:hypothetical protein n=1 Tax=Demequina phytophila TaxID=1638981 RepID=UPI000785E78A|nr:hypothetical protein [Demequina phytophila]